MTDPEPDRETGAWLRRQREARGWAMAEMGRRLVQAAHDNGDGSVPDAGTLKISAYRWERTGRVSERYRLHYCRAFGIDPVNFGKPQDSPGTDNPDSPAATASPAPPGVAGSLLPTPPAMIYLGGQGPVWGESALGQEVVAMAAHESSDHASEHELHGIGETAYGQLRADVVRLSRQMDTEAPLPTFLDLRRVRDRIHTLLDRRLWPRELSDLYFLLGCVNGLMGTAAAQLGYPDAAEELLRASWAYANIIDHDPLRANLRARLADVMYGRERYSECGNLAADGLTYVSHGKPGAELHVFRAYAAARLGDVDTAREAVSMADAARDSDYTDDLLEIGGEFSLSRATHHAVAGCALANASGAEGDATAQLEQAISLYNAGPGPDEEFWFAGKPLAGVNLAVVQVRSGALDAAETALESALALPADQRISDITGRLADVRRELAAPVFHGSPQASDLGEQIEAFGREAVTTGLHSLTG